MGTMDTLCVSILYHSMSTKSVGFRIRVDPILRRDFLEVCRAQDRPAAQVLRDFMRTFVKQNPDVLQRELFSEAPDGRTEEELQA